MAANVSLTQDTANPFSESDLRYNPANPLQVIAASNANNGSVQAQYYSSDGGVTWAQASLPAVSGDTFQSDPALDWTSDGTAWALTIAVTIPPPPAGATLIVRSFKSVNGGKDWTFDSTVSGSQTDTDKPSLWIDHYSPRRDTMYAIWHRTADATSWVSVRNGAGGTWGAPLQVTGSETSFTSDGSDIKSNSAGEVFAFWPDAGGQTLRVAKSTDGGSSFSGLTSGPVKIADTFGKFTIKVPAQAARATASGTIGCLIYVSGGAYRAGSRNDVYACWHDLAGGTGCKVPSDAPNATATSSCTTRIWFARSGDGGQTWSAPVKINDQSGKNDQFFPRLAVDDSSGQMMIIYYDTVNDPNRLKTDIWMQYSTSFGVTWSPAVQVTTAETDEADTPQDNAQEYGDYIGLTVSNGRYFGCWTDRRGGTSSDEQIWGAPLAIPDISFAIDKATFGLDEVSVHASWPKAYWLSVQGFTNEALGFASTADLGHAPSPAPVITVTLDNALNPSLSAAQKSAIRAHLPTVGTFGPAPIQATDPGLTAELQQFLYPYTVSFPSTAAHNALAVRQAAVLTLHASLTVGPITVRASAPIELTKGEDPYVTDLDPDHPTAFPSWLSYDLRFFKVTPSQSHEMFSVPSPADAAGAVPYIQSVLDHLNNPSLITNGDTFETTLQQGEDLSSLEFLPTNSSSHELTFNFAVARVRILANSAVTVHPVRVFFRLFQAATTTSTFADSGPGQGTYRWGTNGSAGHKIPLLGVETDQAGQLEYVTVPCFATERVNLSQPADMKTQTDPPNARSITTVPGTEVDTYFGCWLDLNQPGQTFLIPTPPAAQASWDGPWTATQSLNGAISTAPHQCLIAEIRYDDTPIPAGATGSTSDKLAQRNIAWIDGPNPGTAPSRVMPHPFEVRASSGLGAPPDELLVTWGSMPSGSTASFYLPAVDAAQVITLANRMYRTHRLTAHDEHTVRCPAEGVTFIPVPPGAGSYAGLLAVNLAAGIRRGDIYDVDVLQLSHARLSLHGDRGQEQLAAEASSSPASLAWRQVRGAFRVSIPVSRKEALLYPEERLLAWLRWRISVTGSGYRWYEVLRHYERLTAGRVRGFGGDPGKILPSPEGDVPGRRPGGHGGPEGGEEGEHFPVPRSGTVCTGKVLGLFYDRFGDFEGFTMLTESGHEHAFRGRERSVEQLVDRAWAERITISVLVQDHEPDWPASIVLRRRPGFGDHAAGD